MKLHNINTNRTNQLKIYLKTPYQTGKDTCLKIISFKCQLRIHLQSPLQHTVMENMCLCIGSIVSK